MASRTSERHQLAAEARWLLAERDLDEHEELLDRLDGRVGKMVGLMVGILISTTTASVLLAINLVVGRF